MEQQNAADNSNTHADHFIWQHRILGPLSILKGGKVVLWGWSFPPQWPGFKPRSHCVGFVVDKAALGQVSSEHFNFPSHFPPHSPSSSIIGQIATNNTTRSQSHPKNPNKKKLPHETATLWVSVFDYTYACWTRLSFYEVTGRVEHQHRETAIFLSTLVLTITNKSYVTCNAINNVSVTCSEDAIK
jgi:hypothetical protein